MSEYTQYDNLKVGRTYYTGFEDIEEFSDFYITPQAHLGSTSHNLTTEEKKSGSKSHKAWIYKDNLTKAGINTNHRGYPALDFTKTPLGISKTAVIIDFWAFIDIELSKNKGEDWLSLATLRSYYDTTWPRAYLINLDYKYRLHLMHVANQSEGNNDIYRAENIYFPKNKWVRVTAYIDYTKDNRFNSPFIAVWQDGILAAAARFNDRITQKLLQSNLHIECLRDWDKTSIVKAEAMCGLNYRGGLTQAHFGIYAPPKISKGTVYNDDLTVIEVIK